MTDFISVILPSYNPHKLRLAQTITGLRSQTLALKNWELIVVDNNSTPPIDINLNWHPNGTIVIAKNQGLTFARLRGFEYAKGNIFVMVDDDNILDKNYLLSTLKIFKSNKQLGAAGGRSLPSFEKNPPVWLKEFYSNLALRDLGEQVMTSGWENKYPNIAPIGAGMIIRKEALISFINKSHVITDRIGTSLSSGGDNDIVIEILKSGWHVGYFPSLVLKHIIPEQRVEVKYLAKLLNNTNKSWIQLLESHGMNPWPKIPAWSVPLRKIKAWFVYRAFQNKGNYIKWSGACGMFDGLRKPRV